MIENKEFTLTLPDAADGTTNIDTKRSIVIIGANGSGKTRLGTWIEFDSPQKDKVHRVSAQKSLNMPESTSPVSIEKAECGLLYGYPGIQKGQQRFSFKRDHRWGGKPAIALLDDYQKLMVYLFSEHYERSAKYLVESRKSKEKVETPITKLDIIQDLWEKILPRRELIIGGGKIQTRIKGTEQEYNATEMSDGERIIFYLTGQCLAAPEDGIIVIDEPELHLHKSIQVNLWQELELARPDCLFVYLTHDLEFASSQETAKKIWLKDFDGQKWFWDEVSEIDEFPEELLLQIIGSRKPVIFIEGDNGSFDVALFRAMYKNHLIIPRGSCSQVITSTKTLLKNEQLHHLKVFGIIDRDRRIDKEIENLKANSVFVLDVAEVENLFCVPELIEVVAENLELESKKTTRKAFGFAFECLEKELDSQILQRAANEIKFKLDLFDGKAKDPGELQNKLNLLIKSIDVEQIFTKTKALFDNIIKERNYLSLLRYYNRKSLSSRMSSIFGLKEGKLPEYIIRITKGSNRTKVEKALEKYLPKI